MQLTEHVHLVGSGQNGFSLTHPLDCHVYLLDGGAELALIDTGVGRDVPAILAQIRAAGFAPGDIGTIFITHLHLDHAGGAADRLGRRVDGPASGAPPSLLRRSRPLHRHARHT